MDLTETFLALLNLIEGTHLFPSLRSSELYEVMSGSFCLCHDVLREHLADITTSKGLPDSSFLAIA